MARLDVLKPGSIGLLLVVIAAALGPGHAMQITGLVRVVANGIRPGELSRGKCQSGRMCRGESRANLGPETSSGLRRVMANRSEMDSLARASDQAVQGRTGVHCEGHQ
jgi:hypothetical protein